MAELPETVTLPISEASCQNQEELKRTSLHGLPKPERLSIRVNHTTTARMAITDTSPNIKSVLLYECVTWKVTKAIFNKLQVFVKTACLKKYLAAYYFYY